VIVNVSAGRQKYRSSHLYTPLLLTDCWSSAS